ncbi:GNAT family N-acetyltransferase [Variovorax paradoxus]|jgi:RimJ/RimL family protein N-acetyltransferase|uniref:GNAT family N-acetyltransferase n=1 Tax=Variovorax paradoxus TaxID=34073 RepID=UPI0029C86D2C|nr:GNAT family N-acetyltransferase [Variovorax paradoxus]WPH21225.1 GNAT family N-acetyltransferase [Variovorax paradoxus]
MAEDSIQPLIEFETPRLRLRQWQESDLAPFAALAADPLVMEFLLPVPTRAASDALAARIRARIAEQGWGLWAVEHKASGEFAGFTGLNVPLAALPFSPCVEIGWRFARQWWGQGLATEAARAALQVGFERLGFDEIVAFTALGNHRSAAVMERLGMREDVDGAFDHPAVPEGHALRRHRLYRIARPKQG